MGNEFRIPRGIPIQPPVRTDIPKKPKQFAGETSFQSLFAQELAKQEIKFSAHAEKRMALSGIHLNKEQVGRLVNAVDKVAAKGGKESLIVLDEVAFVVSVPNRTVITAIDKGRLKENVFTNIDSAVIS